MNAWNSCSEGSLPSCTTPRCCECHISYPVSRMSQTAVLRILQGAVLEMVSRSRQGRNADRVYHTVVLYIGTRAGINKGGKADKLKRERAGINKGGKADKLKRERTGWVCSTQPAWLTQLALPRQTSRRSRLYQTLQNPANSLPISTQCATSHTAHHQPVYSTPH